jgi:hypothetical protein
VSRRTWQHWAVALVLAVVFVFLIPMVIGWGM